MRVEGSNPEYICWSEVSINFRTPRVFPHSEDVVLHFDLPAQSYDHFTDPLGKSELKCCISIPKPAIVIEDEDATAFISPTPGVNNLISLSKIFETF
jgi:hypothetical protein